MSVFNPATVLAHHADRFPDRPCLVWAGDVIRYGELYRRVVRTEDLREFCRARLAKFKVEQVVEFVDALPRNPSGKVLKRVLREMADPG